MKPCPEFPSRVLQQSPSSFSLWHHPLDGCASFLRQCPSNPPDYLIFPRANQLASTSCLPAPRDPRAFLTILSYLRHVFYRGLSPATAGQGSMITSPMFPLDLLLCGLLPPLGLQTGPAVPLHALVPPASIAPSATSISLVWAPRWSYL